MKIYISIGFVFIAIAGSLLFYFNQEVPSLEPDIQVQGEQSNSLQTDDKNTKNTLIVKNSLQAKVKNTKSRKETQIRAGTTVADPKIIIQKLATDLAAVERNKLEHLLGANKEEAVDQMVEEMLEDGFMDLSIEDEGKDGPEMPGIANDRMNSAIRIAGLREDESAVEGIIGLAGHQNAGEETIRAAYEALGYIGNQQAVSFLNSEFNSQTNPFLKSEIILSLSTAKNTSNIDKYLQYLKSNDTDLRDSAIIALGSAKENRAVSPFRQIFATTTRSSQILIVQALNKIDTSDAWGMLKELEKTHPHLVNNQADQEEE